MIPFVILAIENEEDRAFMADIYAQYERLLWSEIRKTIKTNPCELEDIYQTLLLKLIQKVDRLKTMNTRSMVNYIITAAKNTSKDALRKMYTVQTISIDDDEWFGREKLHSDDNVEELVFRRENVRFLEEVIPLLDERSRYLINSKYFLGLSNHEIGEALGIKDDSVRVGLSRARKRIKKLLAERYNMTDLS